jgi:AAA domain
MTPIEKSPPALPLISFETIMAGEVPPVEWLVEPLIANGDRVMIYGEFGSFKSWVLPSLALHIAAGRSWLDKFPVPEPKQVLYIDEEMHLRTLTRRIQRLALGMGLHSESLPLRFLSRFGTRLDATGAARLLFDLEKTGFDPQVVIVETLRRVLRGSENEAKDVGEFWRAVAPLSKGRSLIVSHHMRKRSDINNGARERASGSTDILAGADAAFAIQRLGQDALVVECTKLREAEEPEPFVVSLYDEDRDGPMTLRLEGTKANYTTEGNKADQAQQAIVTFLQASPDRTVDRTAILDHLARQGMKSRTAERALSSMTRSGLLQQPARGLYQLGGVS